MSEDTPEIITRCGMRCDLCPAYVPNLGGADLDRASEIWAEAFDFLIAPDKIACCGCLNKREGLLDRNCPVRPPASGVR